MSNAWWGLELVTLPELPPVNPLTAVHANPSVSSDRRVCRVCSPPVKVGQSHDGQEALLKGVCHKCGTPYTFEPRLARGVIVDNRYQVIGCIGFGGVGWVFLAEDTHLKNHHVVLKGLIDPGNPDTASAAKRELELLTEAKHENVVRVHDFVMHPLDDGRCDEYIVMEYVEGYTVEAIATRGNGVLAEQVIAYCLQLLRGLDYLHSRGLLHCDITPSNLMVAGSRVKVIDLGAGCRIGAKGHTWGTRGYRAPEVEVPGDLGRTVKSDLYSAGMTLRTAFSWTREYETTGQGSEERAAGQLGPAIESLDNLISRATARDPAERFRTAAEMAGQLSGVLRDFVALRTARPHTAPLSRFGPEPALPDHMLDEMLGSDLPLTWWMTEDAFRAANEGAGRFLPDLLPEPGTAVRLLPPPRPDPEDPVADLILSLSGTDPVVASGQVAGQDSAEAHLLRCRAELFKECGEAAREAWTRARDRCGDGDYRIRWHKALMELSAAHLNEAFAEFSAVRGALPGEVVPKVSLGLCAEYLGDFPKAKRWYQMAWQTDQSYVSAAFGLARTQMRLGDRAAAVAALDAVPDSSRYWRSARIVAFRFLTGRSRTSGYPTPAELDQAERLLNTPPLKDDKLRTPPGGPLQAVLLEARLGHACSAGGDGSRAAIAARRAELEKCYRGLATRAESKDQHTILIDLANQARARTLD
jgi:serine/threonine-protein kinase PknG